VLIAAECTRTVHGTKSAPLSSRPEMDETEWARFNTGLTKFADFLAEDGLTLVYHHHMGTVIQTEDEIDRMMASTGPAVKLLVHTGDLTWAGADPADYVSVFKARPGYSGWVVIEAEQDPVKAPPARYVKMGYDNLVRFMAEAGWKR